VLWRALVHHQDGKVHLARAAHLIRDRRLGDVETGAQR